MEIKKNPQFSMQGKLGINLVTTYSQHLNLEYTNINPLANKEVDK